MPTKPSTLVSSVDRRTWTMGFYRTDEPYGTARMRLYIEGTSINMYFYAWQYDEEEYHEASETVPVGPSSAHNLHVVGYNCSGQFEDIEGSAQYTAKPSQ